MSSICYSPRNEEKGQNALKFSEHKLNGYQTQKPKNCQNGADCCKNKLSMYIYIYIYIYI